MTEHEKLVLRVVELVQKHGYAGTAFLLKLSESKVEAMWNQALDYWRKHHV